MINKTRISVIVCTYNGEKTILKCLESLNQQIFPKSKAEIILIDNNSNDNTKEIIFSFIKKSEFKIRYFFEPESGLSKARNRGIKEAKGEIAAFIDDDILLANNWLKHINFSFTDVRIATVAGKVNLTFSAIKPNWLTNAHMNFLGKSDFGNKKRILMNNEHPVGCNMAFRKNIFEKIGNFKKELGRKENNLISLEEAEICQRILKTGYQILYEPKVLGYHLIDKDRMNKKYFIKRFFMEGKSAAILDDMNNSEINYISKLLRSFLCFTRFIINNNFEKLCWASFNLGYIKRKLLG